MSTDEPSPLWTGVAIALVAAFILGSAVAVSRYAYADGASGILVAMSRCSVTIVVVMLGLRLVGHEMGLPRDLWAMAALNGVLTGLMTYGNIGAVEYISVGLASLLFYTYPILIAVIVMCFGIERVSVAKLAMIGVAFIGLCIMLGDSIGEVDGRGAGLSLMGALTTAINAVLVGRFFRHVNVYVITLHFSVVALIFLIIVALITGDVRLPAHASGWGGVGGVAVLQALGAPLYYFAIREIGALRTGLVMNLQPVTSITEAWLLFEELLSLLQAIGGALVIGAIAAMQSLDLRDQARSPQNTR